MGCVLFGKYHGSYLPVESLVMWLMAKLRRAEEGIYKIVNPTEREKKKKKKRKSKCLRMVLIYITSCPHKKFLEFLTVL